MKLFDQFGRLLGRQAPAIITRDSELQLRRFGRRYTKDTGQAYQFRMPAGFSGDVNRTHPVAIEPVSMDPTNPITLFGQAGIIDATSHLFRLVQAGDTAITDVYGFAVRPYPFQQSSGTNYGAASIGNGAPGTIGKLDVMRSGYIMTTLNNFAAANVVKGGTINIWIAATSGLHVQGFVEAASSGSNTIALPGTCTFNGPSDSAGIVEIIFHP